MAKQNEEECKKIREMKAPNIRFVFHVFWVQQYRSIIPSHIRQQKRPPLNLMKTEPRSEIYVYHKTPSLNGMFKQCPRYSRLLPVPRLNAADAVRPMILVHMQRREEGQQRGALIKPDRQPGVEPQRAAPR